MYLVFSSEFVFLTRHEPDQVFLLIYGAVFILKSFTRLQEL